MPAAGAPVSRDGFCAFRRGDSSEPNESERRILRPADRAGLLSRLVAEAERGLPGTFAFSADAARGVSVEMIIPFRSNA